MVGATEFTFKVETHLKAGCVLYIKGNTTSLYNTISKPCDGSRKGGFLFEGS